MKAPLVVMTLILLLWMRSAQAAPIQVAAADSVRREAVIVGVNKAPRLALAPLHYADDDAIKLAALLDTLGVYTALFTQVDADSAALYPQAKVKKPARATVLQALSAAIARIDAARARGQKGELIFAYSGHGDVDREGRGRVYLDDGVLSQQDLADALGPASRRFQVTLIIDACNAALLVGVRGRGAGLYGDRQPLKKRAAPLARAGLLLSTSGRAEVQEWDALRSGVFSYELRSGLLGAADLDDDRRISFAELDAFIAAANARITNPIARLRPTIRGPAGHAQRSVLDLNQARPARFVRIGPKLSGHLWLLGEDLVRYADFNKDAQQRFSLLLQGQGAYALRDGQREWPILPDARPQAATTTAAGKDQDGPQVSFNVADLSAQPLQVASRGFLADQFQRHLFSQPYSLRFARDYWAHPPQYSAPPPLSWRENAALVLAPYKLPLSAAGLMLALGGLSYAGSWLSHDAAQQTPWADETQRYNTLTTGLSGAGVAVAGSGLVLVVASGAVLSWEYYGWQHDE